MSGRIEAVNPKEVMLDNILAFFEGQTFSATLAARIVGGEEKLRRFAESGAIECEKRVNAQNGKWHYNAAQVLRHCRNMRPTRNRKQVKPKKSKQ